MSAQRIPAVCMRGGTAKGLFFHGRDLPREHEARDALLLRVLGGPDPDGRYADGMGAAAPDTSGVAVVTPSRRDDCDVDCLIGTIAGDPAAIGWTGESGDLVAAVGPFAVSERLVHPVDGITRVRIWLPAAGRRVEAFVPVRDGRVVEEGCFVEDGVPFASAEVRLEFAAPAIDTRAPVAALLPTGSPRDVLDVPGLGPVPATLIDAGSPIVFVRADALKLTGREAAATVERDRRLLGRLAALRAQAAARMGLAGSAAGALRSGDPLPEVAWVSRPAASRTLSGTDLPAERVDLLVRVLSVGRLHAACGVAGPVALAAAAALPGTVVAEVARTLPGVPTRIGHPSGALAVGAEVALHDGRWRLDRAVISRGARRLMTGAVHVPSAGVSSRA